MTLDEQYQKIIDDQRAYLLKLQDDFNKKCDESKVRAHAALKDIPKENKEARAGVLKAQKEELAEALKVLRAEVDQSTKRTMKLLEGIVTEKEKLILEGLEHQLESL